MLNGFLLIQLNTIHLFITGRTEFPALFYMLICSVFPGIMYFAPVLIASTLIIILMIRTFGSYKKDGLSYNFLDAGILIALASFFYLPALLLYPLLLIMLAIIRPNIWREWVFTLIGVALPYIFLFSYYFIAGKDTNEMIDKMYVAFFSANKGTYGLYAEIFAGYSLLLIVTGSVHMMLTMGKLKIHSRKFFIVFLWIFLFSVALYFVVPLSGPEVVYIAAIPISYLFSYYFVFCRPNWVNNLLLFLFFAAIAAVKILG